MLVIAVISACIAVTSAFGRSGFGPTPQEWGYVTVRPGAHMFWWLQHTLAKVDHYTERPLVIWLQGGPGASGTAFGNFAEIGPLDLELHPRNSTWLNDVNLLFVDNPVGTGFSYVEDMQQLTKSHQEIAEDFLVLLKAIFEKLPELKRIPLYIFSESYGGKMAVDIALALDQAVKLGKLQASLLGIGLGDSWIDPINITLTWGAYLYNLGIVDDLGRRQIEQMALRSKIAFDQGNYALSRSYHTRTENVMNDLSAHVDFYNVLKRIKLNNNRLYDYPADDPRLTVIMNSVVKVLLKLNSTWGAQSKYVIGALTEDFMKPVTKSIELLLNTTNIKIGVYNGQLDLCVTTMGVMNWLEDLKYPQNALFKAAPRNPIVVNNTIEGFYKKYGKLAMYWVQRSGHMVPAENHAAMHYILKDMIHELKR